MSEFPPVRALGDIADFDRAEMARGYCDGIEGVPESHDSEGRSYQHGWKNGATDAGYREMDADQVAFQAVYAPVGFA